MPFLHIVCANILKFIFDFAIFYDSLIEPISTVFAANKSPILIVLIQQ